MKIAILTGTFSHFSGIDHVVYEQCRSLVNKNHEVTIIALSGDMELSNVVVREIGMPKNDTLQRLYRLLFFFDRIKIKKITYYLRSYDEIYSHQYPLNLIAMAAKKKYGVRYIYYNHGIAPSSVFQSWAEKMYIWLFIRLTNYTIRRADRIISVSKYLAETIKKETGKLSEVLYNKIDSNRFHDNIDGRRIRTIHQLGNNPVILYVGRISPHKGVHLLIQAFNRVLTTVPRAQLLIVGKETFPRYSRRLRKIARYNTHFIGFVSDDELPQYYAAADVYATATLWEGFDLPVIEAQAVGISVVAFDIGPHKEIVNTSGTLVAVKDIAAFTKALELKIINPN